MKTQTVKHTPGPWESFGYAIVKNGRPFMIAKTYPEEGEKLGDAESIANARLIAAAPDLLEACKALLKMIEEIPDDWLTEECEGFSNAILDASRVAIAKAEGNQ